MAKDFIDNFIASLASACKICFHSRRVSLSKSPRHRSLMILGNGPSLLQTLDLLSDSIEQADLMAVNFFANTEKYVELKPNYYVIMDPHFFFGKKDDPNVVTLFDRINTLTDWPMTLFIPVRMKKHIKLASNNIRIETFNSVGIEGFSWLEKLAFSAKLGMPRPRNVLIPSIMIGIWMGYKTIYIAGADHSWMKTLGVNDNNQVISIQPHFYEDNEHESKRVENVYSTLPLHQVVQSFYIAFKSYHKIARFIKATDISIYNLTPGSFIDAFPKISGPKLI